MYWKVFGVLSTTVVESTWAGNEHAHTCATSSSHTTCEPTVAYVTLPTRFVWIFRDKFFPNDWLQQSFLQRDFLRNSHVATKFVLAHVQSYFGCSSQTTSKNLDDDGRVVERECLRAKNRWKTNIFITSDGTTHHTKTCTRSNVKLPCRVVPRERQKGGADAS